MRPLHLQPSPHPSKYHQIKQDLYDVGQTYALAKTPKQSHQASRSILSNAKQPSSDVGEVLGGKMVCGLFLHGIGCRRAGTLIIYGVDAREIAKKMFLLQRGEATATSFSR